MSKAFYNSVRWKTLRKSVLARDRYLCRNCRRYMPIPKAASIVHHCFPLEDYPQYAFAGWNLISLCVPCHDKMHDRITNKLTPLGESWMRRVSPPVKNAF